MRNRYDAHVMNDMPENHERYGWFGRNKKVTPRKSNTGLLHVASYNVHRCVGLDGLHHPERIARVIKELGVDILGLQEVALSTVSLDGAHQIEYLARKSGLHVLAGPTVLKGHRRFGNALLTRFDVCASRQIDLSLPGRPPRGALDVDLDCNGRMVRVIVAHLGLRPAERKKQVMSLLDIIGERHRHRPTILLGDMNEWIPRAKCVKELRASFNTSPSLATFPSRLPVLPLDRIFVWPEDAFVRTKVHMSSLARVASDHLPIKGSVRLE
jgi:endonuclease/exonuclease/phosphatase family metal-dependent hydrolase